MSNKLYFFLTRNSTLKSWHNAGTIERELKIYLDLAKNTNLDLIIFSYGIMEDEKKIIEDLNLNISVFGINNKLSILPRRLRNILHLLFFSFQYSKSKGIIQTNQLSGSLNALFFSKFSKNKMFLRMGYYYTHFRGITLNEVPRSLEKILFRNVEKIIVTNPLASDFINRNSKFRNCIYIPNFIDKDIFCYSNQDLEFDFIYVGRFVDRKGSNKFIEMIKENPSKKFLLITDVNKISNLNYLESFGNLLIKNTIKNRELPRYFNKSIFMVALSDYEGCPKSYIEGAACGCSLIYNDVAGVAEFFDKYNWYNDFKIKSNIEYNKNEFNRKKRSDEIVKEFTYQKIFNQYLELYKNNL